MLPVSPSKGASKSDCVGFFNKIQFQSNKVWILYVKTSNESLKVLSFAAVLCCLFVFLTISKLAVSEIGEFPPARKYVTCWDQG